MFQTAPLRPAMSEPDPGPPRAGPAHDENRGGATDTAGPGRLLHVAGRDDWAAASRSGNYRGSTRGRTLAQEGFVHASAEGQLPGVLHRFYSDVPPAELVLLVVDFDRLAAAGIELRWERPPGATERFPHLYGGLPVSAVLAALPLTGGPDGFARPDLTGYRVVPAPPD